MKRGPLFLMLAACGAGGGDDTSGDDGPPIPKCDVTHFAPIHGEFALPNVGADANRVPFAEMFNSNSVIGMKDPETLSVIAYATLDIDGDFKPDLVMTERNVMATVGTSRWLVYKNMGTGFAPTPIDWPLPDVGAAADRTPFAEIANSNAVLGPLSGETLSVMAYALVDMDGDHKPDLVMTERNALPGVGVTRWLVYTNTGAGFAPAPIDFALPNVGAAAGRTPFADIANSNAVIGPLSGETLSVMAYALLDMDADGKPDLVMTERNALPGVGTSKWLVFQNTGTGFAPMPADFTLPAVGAEPTRTPFADLANSNSVIGQLTPDKLSVIAYTTMDLDADRKPDLVMTERNAMPGIGTNRWLLFKNMGTGFAPTPVDRALPDVGAAADRTPFADIANGNSVIGMLDAERLAVIGYATTDLNGDGKPDLVMTERNRTPGVGTTTWQVFANTGTGFGPAVDFALPNVGAAADRTPFADLANSNSVIGQQNPETLSVIAYATTEIDGDGKADLVLTERTVAPGVGTAVWQVFSGACDEKR